MYKTRKANYVKRNTVERSNDDLYHGNTTVLRLKHARPCQKYNTYLKIYISFIIALRTSLPVR